jgi:hypothetical protein
VRTRHLQLVTSEHSDTTTNRESVLSPYGPVRAGSTTWRVQEIYRANQEAQLTELLSCLEKKVATLVSKSCTVLDTLNTVTQEVSAVLSSTQTEEDGTDV